MSILLTILRNLTNNTHCCSHFPVRNWETAVQYTFPYLSQYVGVLGFPVDLHPPHRALRPEVMRAPNVTCDFKHVGAVGEGGLLCGRAEAGTVP